MKKYKAVILDLFDTVVNFNPSRLPSAEINGIQVRSTGVAVYEVFKKHYGHVSFDEFYVPFIESYVEFQQIKLKTHREFHNGERFRLMLGKMNVGEDWYLEKTIDEMVLAHMGKIADAIDFPSENRDLLDSLNEVYRLALVSNFDHAPTAYGVLEKFGIKKYFEKIVISMEAGWRKPKADIFYRCLDELRIKPEDAIFVGDNFEADVAGSKAVAMDVIWINKNGEELSERNLQPDYVVSKLAEIREILL